MGLSLLNPQKNRSLLSPLFAEDNTDSFFYSLFPFETSQRFFPSPLPSVDIKEKDNSFEISADLPGMSPENVKVTLEKGVLTISGERKFETEEKKEGYTHRERSYGSFSRSFQLPENIDDAQVNATYKNGVLELSIPKTATAKPKSIDIKIH